jgi:AcrR family transcriptional regulator
LRERRRIETAERLSAVSRRLTAERGLQGFTIEEVCEEVGVSRRTFFNYFHGKEESVLGIDEDDVFQRFTDDFLERGSRGWPAVVDDLFALTVAHIDRSGIEPALAGEFVAVIEREPHLLKRAMGAGRTRERQLISLVERREGLPPGDRRAEVLVLVLSTLLRSGMERYLASPRTTSLESVLADSLSALRAVFVA